MMYFDYISQKFTVEKRAHFLCKDVAVLPNGAPLVVAENGELYLFISRKKLMGKDDFDSSTSPEMIRIVDN